jgi:hypothetical protein
VWPWGARWDRFVQVIYDLHESYIMCEPFCPACPAPPRPIWRWQEPDRKKCNLVLQIIAKQVNKIKYTNKQGHSRQGCWWNERSLNRGLNRCRGLGLGGPFFLIHVRSSKSTRHFKFGTNSVSVSPRSYLKRSRSSSIAFEANAHPAHQPTPQKILVWCVSQGSMHS